MAGEVLAHGHLAAEARAARDFDHGEVGAFEEFLGAARRCAMSQRRGVVPVVAWKWRAKERGTFPRGRRGR